jgi:hypothetical protein
MHLFGAQRADTRFIPRRTGIVRKFYTGYDKTNCNCQVTALKFVCGTLRKRQPTRPFGAKALKGRYFHISLIHEAAGA